MMLQIKVISLINSDKRRRNAISQLNQLGLNWSFLDAINGKNLREGPKEYLPKKVKNLLGFELTPSELGCFLSHKKVWQECLKTNLPTIVFEDDFILRSNFIDVIQILIANLNQWNFVRLQALNEVQFKVLHRYATFELVLNMADPIGGTAYILQPNAAKILIEKSKYIFEPLDHFLEHKSFHGLDFLAIKPYPVFITNEKSTILDRPTRLPIVGFSKIKRSCFRFIDRLINNSPWFP